MNITGNFTEDTLKNIWKVNQENKKLKEENQRLNNILNELKKELEQEYAVNKTNSIEEFNNPEWYIKWNCYKNILDKLNELKESDK